MQSTQPMQPTAVEINSALQAGFQSIDDGDGFYAGFEAYLQAFGYRKRQDIACTCSDGGSHGHLPECRWVKG